ncbi:hypothetical protein BB558_002784 [Smittium angustum]|uniref:Expansin-like EG45 domain-containing protein n=1 Tax=Smittium angustum TaxID=133377 RepID=A0A2U1J7T5_SMIAN|nr:hypothetical protein BB558_002784 [Smittium angustum]
MKLFALFLLFVLTLVSSAPIPDQNVFRVIKKLAIKRLRFTTVTQTIDATSILITVLPPQSPAGGQFSGDGTFYDAGLGSCGWNNSNSDFIAAINAPQYGNTANPNNAPVCGQCALVTGPNGNSVKVKIVDRCPVCAYGSLDLSPAAFNVLASPDAGRISITWDFVPC